VAASLWGTPSGLPAISPSRGESGKWLLLRSQINVECWENDGQLRRKRRSIHSPPLRGRCPAGQRGVLQSEAANETSPHHIPFTGTMMRGIRCFDDGRFTL
jgi:hypothetical protein